MNDNTKYLNDLKQELNLYKKQLSTIKDSFKDKTNGDANKIYDSLKSILKESSEAYQKLEAASAAEWEPLKKIASESFKQLKQSFDEYANSAADHIKVYSQETMDLSAEYIKNNPLKSILLAAGLGFIIGRVLK